MHGQQNFKKIPHILLHLQSPDRDHTGPYSEPDDSVPHPTAIISLILFLLFFSHLLLGLSPSHFPTNILQTFLFFHTCRMPLPSPPAYVTSLITYTDEHKSWEFSLCSSHQSPGTFAHSPPNLSFNIPISKTLGPCFPFWQDRRPNFTPSIKQQAKSFLIFNTEISHNVFICSLLLRQGAH